MASIDDSRSVSPARRLGPYFFVRGRPFREARLRAYIVGQHRLGRALGEILDDPYVGRCGGRSLAWRVICQPETIAALGADVRAEIEALSAALGGSPSA
jgi:hypothetical protein